MNTNRRRAVAALVTAGLLWGTTVPLSKVALQWLQPGWLTAVRFGLAALILLAVTPRARLRAACSPLMLASGAIGYGGSVVLQNAGITRTSVTHAALLIGTTPVLVAVIAAVWQKAVARPIAWAGFALSLAGVVLVAGGGGGGASMAGDVLVVLSLLIGATFTVAQGRLLRGRDPVAVTAVQFIGAALVAVPFSAATEGLPAAPPSLSVVLITLALAAGTLLPFTLFAYGQSRVAPEVAGAFLNIEPLVGAVAGIVVFADPFGPAQAAGGAAIIVGIALGMLPLFRPARTRQPAPELVPVIGPEGPELVPAAGPRLPELALATRPEMLRLVPVAAPKVPELVRAVPAAAPVGLRLVPAVPAAAPVGPRLVPAAPAAAPVGPRLVRAVPAAAPGMSELARAARAGTLGAPDRGAPPASLRLVVPRGAPPSTRALHAVPDPVPAGSRPARPLGDGHRHAPDLHVIDGDPRRGPGRDAIRRLPGVLLAVEEEEREPLAVSGL
jgi:O-acetylserine/cysteine efflux transporter